MSDHKADATKVVALIEADLRRYDWRYMPATAHGYVEAALSAAYTRGLAKGLLEANAERLVWESVADGQYVAGAKFGWNCAVENAAERFRGMVEGNAMARRDWKPELAAARAANNARLSAIPLSPIPTEGSMKG